MNTKQLRQKILDLAIRGKLVPQDPNDEPASVLLERIRAEKERLIKEGKIKRDKKESAKPNSGDKPHYGKLPQGWILATLSKISLNRDGERIPVSSATRSELKKTYDYYGASGVIDKIDRFIFNEDLLLIGEDGANLLTRNKPIAFIASGKYWVNNHAHVIDAADKVILQWLCVFINSIDLSQFVTGSAQPKITQDNLNSIIVPLPPLAEQRRIVAAIESAFAVVYEIERNKADLQSAVSAAKKKILSLAIRGKLVPQDPGDEPASVLLERVRAERGQLAKDGKIKRGKSESETIRSVDNSHYEKIGVKPNCIDNQIPFEVPQSWSWHRLSELWELLSGRDLSPSDYTDEESGIPYITGASNFTERSLIINRWTTCPKVVVKNGDLLITCKGTIGTMTINTQGDMHIARQIMAIKNCHKLDIGFLRIIMEAFIVKITTSAKGIIPGISREDLLEMLLPCPPIPEQRRIQKTITSIFAYMDRMLENLN
jgi:Restriction endonuclease S subunits